MFLVTSNKEKRLLYLSYIERIGLKELQRSQDDLKALLAELQPGFRLLVDLDRLDSMEVACAPEIGRIMELIDQSGVSLVVRVIPDPKKDIGLNILTLFHYRRRPRVVTCKSMAEAAKQLSL